MPTLTVESLSKTFGAVRAVDDVTLHVGQGEMLVLVGPSGCGKTTCLRCLAGLERPTAGRILIGDRTVTAIEDGIFVTPEKREIGMVFQSYAIWPHMTVFENVAYPLRAMRVPRDNVKTRVMNALALVQLDGLADRYSSQISGGQQQRVALARSLVSEPSLLLFDEPLSNLDANLRLQMRIEIKDLQRRLGFTAVYVTHDQTEAMAIADRIAIMEGGVLRQLGTPREIYERPANVFVAGFMGTTNLFGGAVVARGGTHSVLRTNDGLEVRVADTGGTVGEAAYVSIRPEALALLPGPPAAGGDNVWPACITLATYVGDSIIYRAEIGAHQIEVHARPNEVFDNGAKVYVAASPEQCILLHQ